MRCWSRCVTLLAVGFLVYVFASRALLAKSKPVSASDLDRLIQEKQYPQLRDDISSAQLNSIERTYFEGILADRENRVKRAIALLEPILPTLRRNNPHRAAAALDALGSDYFMVGQYAKSVQAYSELLGHSAFELSPARKKQVRDTRNTLELLHDSPPQTLSGRRHFRVPLRRDPLGDLDVPVEIAGSTYWWILDTGANLSTITARTAKHIGAVVSKGHASTQGSTGFESPVATAVIPRIRVGKAVIRNVPTLVLDDKLLNIDVGKGRHIQISGILGYPELAALGSLTVSKGVLTIQPRSRPSAFSSPLWIDELNPLLQLTVSHREVLFVLDTGDDNAELTRKFVSEFPSLFADLKLSPFGLEGVGGPLKLNGYIVPRLHVQIGKASAVLRNTRALTSNRGLYPLDELYGNLGQSFLRQFGSYTIDFRRMRFSVTPNSTQ